MLLVSSLALLSTTVFTVVAAAPINVNDERIIYGYRQVSPEQAKKYNEAKTLTDDPNIYGTQIGKGVYTTPVRNGWDNAKGDWHCVIYGSSDALKRASKAWIPETHDGDELWFKSEEKINNYIKDLNPGWSPNKTLRMSYIAGWGRKLQMVIPHDLLNSRGGAMGLWVECKEKWGDLPDVVVDYDSWHHNIKGERTDPGSDSDTDMELGLSGSP